MFNPINIPADSVMLYNAVYLKAGYTIQDAEQVIGEMCHAVKENYADDGFIAGQVFKYAGFVSDEGTVGKTHEGPRPHLAVLTYWKGFDAHERSHADELFKKHFGKLIEMSTYTFEYGYELLWQGEPETV